MKLIDLIHIAVDHGFSDIHLKAGLSPHGRRAGRIMPISEGLDPMTPEILDKIAYTLMTTQQAGEFQIKKDVDLSFGVPGIGRFRVNISNQRGSLRIVLRTIHNTVPTMTDLNLPEILTKIADSERGLVLVTGTTGSGKSTTIAAMIQHINMNHPRHIITIEDPIEYLIQDQKALVTQKEVGADVVSFSSALRAALRQDPDVIFIGEMRDLETIETAMLAAETGHLVFSTLHTIDAQETINRIISTFPPNQQSNIRIQLATTLRAVVSQRLARRADGVGRVAAVEVLINTDRIKSLILDPEKSVRIRDAMEEGHHSYGMQSFDQHLLDLLTAGVIDKDEALRLCTNQENFILRMSGIKSMDGHKFKAFDRDNEGLDVPTLPNIELENDETEISAKNGPSKSDDKNNGLPRTPRSLRAGTAPETKEAGLRRKRG